MLEPFVNEKEWMFMSMDLADAPAATEIVLSAAEKAEVLANGLGLMGFGMGTVFVFLVILIIAMTLMSTLVTKYLPDASIAPVKPKVQPGQGVDPQLLNVLAAAVKEHRARQK
ncbi:MAG: oxaloacetate decarboxylase gamma subunit [Psychrobacter glaciei]|jgi:oxaloacetate decarboxylase gamma subunit